jgi:type VI secretion system protein VasJ
MELKDIGSTPVSETLPAGCNVTALPDFEALEAEIAKLASVAETGSLDWDEVIRLATGLLQQGKDLKVGGCLCAALAQTRRQEGLALGLHIYRELLEGFWEAMTPPIARMRGRRNVVQWLLDRIALVGPGWPVVAWPKDQRDPFLADLLAIDEFLAAHMEEAPILRPLIQQARVWVEEPQEAPSRAPAAPPRPGSPSEAPTPAPLPRNSPPALTVPSTEGADPTQLLAQTLDHLAQVGGLLLDQDPSNPVPYVLNRVAAWLALRALPTADQGQTRIPPPAAQATDALAAARTAQNTRLILTQAEALLPGHIFWLDLNRMVTESLDALGWGGAARTVEQETRSFVRKMPGLESLTFADGTPFADEATRQWLQQAVGGEARASSPGEAGNKAHEEARRLAGAGNLAQAVTLLAQEGQSGTVGREAFRCKVTLCGLLARGRKGRVAGAVARDLLVDLERFQVPAWEPELAVQALQAILAGLYSENRDANDPLVQSAFGHLALLDPAQALEQS